LIEVNCVFAPTIETPAHIELAEQLGYRRAWVYDSPVLWADPWVTLGLASQRTETIRLGPCVITPHVRHITANAAAVVQLQAVAPDRVDLGVGVGFTSAALIGQPSARWAFIEEYVAALRGLLAGEVVEWEGVPISLMHGRRTGMEDDVEVPIWLAAHGPKGLATAERLGANVITNPVHGDNPVRVGGKTCWVTCYGTVLDEGETFDSQRVLDAAGPGAAFGLHLGANGPLAGMPEQLGHAQAIARLPAARREIEVHRGHLTEPSEIDTQFLTGACVERATITAPPEGIAGFLASLEANGAAGVVYQPGGSHIERELEAFAEAAGVTPA
jgi:5,10-methylenetetrahydromethanopterin reductase